MHSIELLLDPATDEAVRGEWALLAEAGLPSQARHTGASNAPHVTLLAAPGFDASHDDELAEAMSALPLPVTLGPLLVFGRPPRGLVLARGIVVSRGILRLHERVDGIAHDATIASHSRPGAWTPHVTLAMRLDPDQLAAAVRALEATPTELEGTFASARRWDGTERRITPLG